MLQICDVGYNYCQITIFYAVPEHGSISQNCIQFRLKFWVVTITQVRVSWFPGTGIAKKDQQDK